MKKLLYAAFALVLLAGLFLAAPQITARAIDPDAQDNPNMIALGKAMFFDTTCR